MVTGVWVHGCVWVCVVVGVWVCVGMVASVWVCGCVWVWLCGFVWVWDVCGHRCGYVGVCGCGNVCGCGCVGVVVGVWVCMVVCECVCVLVAQSCLTLCDSMDCSPPGSSVHGILQARILEWVAMPSSRGSYQPRDQTLV